jgi:lipooligosaccharide transport system ATP-binding protein
MSLDPDLTVIQNLMIYGSYFDIPKKIVHERVDELLTFFHLIDKRSEKIDRLSGGMKRRLLTARALMNKPDLLILDEPTTGLDPQSRHVMWDRLRDLRSQGVTTLVTTHYMEETEVLCDRIVVIDHGKIIDEGNPKMLIQKYGARNLEEVFLKLTGRELRD